MRRLIILFISLTIIIGVINSAYSQDIDKDAQTHYQIGNFYYQQGRYKEAEEEFQKALELIKEKPVTKTELVSRGEKDFVRESRDSGIEYIIGEGDILDISVWQNPDLDREAIVRPDGRISFPLVGDLPAVGLTITQLDEQLTNRLKEYIKFSEVSISIKKIGGEKVIVLGEVDEPGVYSVTGAKTILEAIGLAGGFTNHAVTSSVILIRGGFQKPQAQRINLTKAIKRGDTRLNIPLESEDVIFIPKKFIANVNYFLSQILDPLIKGNYRSESITSW